MKVIVDTSVWSVVLRKQIKKLTEQEKKVKTYLTDLIADSRVQLLGPIRQELLSGISNETTYYNLKNHLESFEDADITREDYETAAQYFNKCMRNGIQGSHIDFLIFAVSMNHHMPIYTLDKDFIYFSKYLDIDVQNLPE
ncbi:MAG: PIN domain-containing protein [Leptospirales bacterium]